MLKRPFLLTHECFSVSNRVKWVRLTVQLCNSCLEILTLCSHTHPHIQCMWARGVESMSDPAECCETATDMTKNASTITADESSVAHLYKVTTKSTREAARSAPPPTADGVERCRNRKPTWRDGCSTLTSIFRLRGGDELSRMWGGSTARRDQSRKTERSVVLLRSKTKLDFDV